MDSKWRATLNKYRQNLSYKAERINTLWQTLQQQDDAASWQISSAGLYYPLLT